MDTRLTDEEKLNIERAASERRENFVSSYAEKGIKGEKFEAPHPEVERSDLHALGTIVTLGGLEGATRFFETSSEKQKREENELAREAYNHGYWSKK